MDVAMTIITAEIFVQIVKAAPVLLLDSAVTCAARIQPRFFFQDNMLIETFKALVTACTSHVSVHGCFVSCGEFGAVMTVCAAYLQVGAMGGPVDKKQPTQDEKKDRARSMLLCHALSLFLIRANHGLHSTEEPPHI